MGITIFGISQQRKKQSVMNAFEDPNKAAVADGDLHYADVIIKLSKTSGGNDPETKKKEVFKHILPFSLNRNYKILIFNIYFLVEIYYIFSFVKL